MTDTNNPLVDLVEHRVEIMGVISAMVPDYAKAEDIYQDVAVEIARHKEQYDQIRAFLPWAKGVARNLVKRYYRAQGKMPVSFLNDLDYLSGVAADRDDEKAGLWARKRHALQLCMERLSEKNRRLVFARYGRNLKGKRLEDELGGSAGSMRVTLHRIRGFLRECISGNLAQTCQDVGG